jgi:hypothetical protein
VKGRRSNPRALPSSRGGPVKRLQEAPVPELHNPGGDFSAFPEHPPCNAYEVPETD